MPTQVFMPQLGESVVEGTITKWLKVKGDHIEEYEPLLEINTDKVDSEIPSPAAGVLLDILVPEGTTVHAGTPLAWIGEPGETAPVSGVLPGQPLTQAAPPTVIAPQAPVAGSAHGPGRDLGFISPVVSRIASEHHIDLAQVPGTGQAGRITKKDILDYIERQQAAPVQAVMTPPTAPSPTSVTPQSEAAAPVPKFPEPAPLPAAGDVLPLTVVRRAIAEHMVLSKHTSPHVTTVMEADLSRIVAHREANKAAFAREGVKLTFTAYFMSAAVQALRAYPLVNSSWSDSGIILHPQINLGMATSLGADGLIVPVIKTADSLSLLGLARSINDLATRARNRKLQPNEVKGGTFTITNHGISGSLFATPIINQPQCGILGVGAIQKRVVVVSSPGLGDTIAIRQMVYLGLTFDHRILDGASADTFLAKVVESLENWS